MRENVVITSTSRRIFKWLQTARRTIFSGWHAITSNQTIVNVFSIRVGSVFCVCVCHDFFFYRCLGFYLYSSHAIDFIRCWCISPFFSVFFCLLCIFFIHLNGFWNAENDFVASIELSSKYTNCQQCINSFACPHHCAQCIYTDKEI